MLSRLLKPPSKDSRKKGSKDDLKEASLHEQLHRVRQEDLPTPCTPRTPRLERARNLRWHLVELDKFEEIPRLSISSYSIASDTSRHEILASTLSDVISPLDIENQVDNKVDSKGVQGPLPTLESSSESASKGSISPQTQQQHVYDDCDDGERTSSEYSAGSSAGSPPTTAEAVGVAWEGAGLCTKAASSFTPRARRKVSTTKRLQSNGLEKITTVSIPIPPQEKIEAVRSPSPLPIPSSTKYPCRGESSPCSFDVARGDQQTGKSVHNNFSGPLRVREKRDQSPNLFARNPLVSPSKSEVAGFTSHGRKGVRNNLSGPLFVQGKRDNTPFRSPPRSPLQSPGRSPLSSPKLKGAAISSQPGLHDDTQIAHPLPLPWPSNTAPVSPRSNTSSADRSEDSCKVDPPLVSARWSRTPSGTDLASSGGRWIKGALLGSGSFGKVYRGHHNETGDMCAIKEVEIVADDPRSKECAKQLAQEIALLSMLRHPNILHYKGSEMVNGESLYIYLELVSGGSIYRLLQEFNTFAEPVIRRYTRQILLGLQFLHAKNTVHRDIKCANILVDQDGRVKLADFGMAKLIGKETAPLSFKGSPYWMAPEVILQNNTGYECAVDIWSLGCTVIEMASGKPPWHQYEGYAAMFKVMNCHEVPIPKSLSPIGQNFVSLCLQRDPAKRPSATMLLEHPFVQVDRDASCPSQAVNDILFQGMMKKNVKDSRWPLGAPSQFTSRDSSHYSNDVRSPRPSHQGHIPTSRSAVQLSDYSRPRPGRGTRRVGRLTDTEDYASQYEGSPATRSGLPNRHYTGIQGIQAAEHRYSGLDPQTPRSRSPRN